MAESRQFGGPKIRQFGDRTGGSPTGECAQCEAMLADALDGTLTAEEQELFDKHTAHCGECSQMLADAQLGVAWLEMLRHPKPEPPAALLERILAQTSGHTSGAPAGAMQHDAVPVAAMAPGYASADGLSNILPFRERMTATVRGNAFAQILLQPRLAMTAAMAFFSIALTMNLTGVHLQDLRASNLRPSSLRRDFFSANARVVQYYEGLRVVYELESRVHDLESATDNDTPAGSQTAPQSATPSAQPPATQPPAGEPQQEQQQPEQKPQRPAPSQGTSRSESGGRTLRLASLEVPSLLRDAVATQENAECDVAPYYSFKNHYGFQNHDSFENVQGGQV